MCALSAQRRSAEMAERSRRILASADGLLPEELTDLAISLFRLSRQWLDAAGLVARPCLRSQAYEYYATGYRQFAEAFLIIGTEEVAPRRDLTLVLTDEARQLFESANQNVSLGLKRTAEWDARNT